MWVLNRTPIIAIYFFSKRVNYFFFNQTETLGGSPHNQGIY